MSSKARTIPYLFLLLPFDFMLAFCLLASLPLCFFKRKNRGSVARKPNTDKVTVIIVNWDGRHLLEECLPSVIEAASYDGSNHDILIVDNGSTDGSAEFIRRKFPSVAVLPLDRNYGFIGGNNRGVQAVRTEVVILLNNDMIVDPGFIRPLLDGFSDPSVFAVTSQIFFADTQRRREETGKTRARFEHGSFYLWHDDISSGDQMRQSLPVFWAGGGSCAVDREKYLTIGGFDPLYRPFYVEDADLSYQAWKRGWKCLLAPASRVVHKHRSTSKAKFGQDFVENTIRKNQYLFVWKNLTDASMLLEHFKNLPRIHAQAMLNSTPSFEVRAFFRALLQLPEVLRKRVANKHYNALSDREILAQSQKP